MFRSLTAVLVFISASMAFAFGLPSTVDGITVKNAHFLTEDRGQVFRGAEPKSKVSELIDFGITDVLIIKKDTKGEVQKEIAAWKQAGFSDRQISQYDIVWDDLEDERKNCEDFVSALEVVRKALTTNGAKLYLHCTAGEDRTGLLSGLVRMLQDGWSAQRAFKEEMCAHGYADGQGKPARIASLVYKSLNPTWIKLSNAVADGHLSWGNLDAAVCLQPISPAEFSKWRCR